MHGLSGDVIRCIRTVHIAFVATTCAFAEMVNYHTGMYTFIMNIIRDLMRTLQLANAY